MISNRTAGLCAFLLMVSALFLGHGAVADEGNVSAGAVAAPGQEDARMQWWRDAKFGLFIHWGPASVSGKEISWGRIGHPFDHPGHESVPAEEYDNLYKRFDPVKFDANAWMDMAARAGMKYVVFITKHHDGFSMWPTKLRDYNIMNSPFKRDICKEIADAAHSHGLKLGWYYSTRDWTHPDYLAGDNKKYNAFYEGQVRELLTNYGRVDVMWFDHTAGNWRDYTFDELFKMMYALQPGILVNNRAARFIRKTEDEPAPEIAKLVAGDFDTPEQEIGRYMDNRAWESCVTLTKCGDGGGWSYRPDGQTRNYEECIKMLVSTVTGDGNLLLNVGPMPTGEIVPEQVDVLDKMGEWLRKYGESIYGTRGGPIRNGAWGGVTRRGKTLYVHVFHWDGGRVKLPALNATIVGSSVLTGGQAEVKQDAHDIEIRVAPKDQDTLDTIVRLELDRPAV